MARFHLGNGARLERINWLADTSEKGLREGHGLMVNYRYELDDIEKNHEAYAQDGTVAASRAVRGQLRRPAAKSKGLSSAVPDLLALPASSSPRSGGATAAGLNSGGRRRHRAPQSTLVLSGHSVQYGPHLFAGAANSSR